MQQLIIPNYNIPYTGTQCERFAEETTDQRGIWSTAVHAMPPNYPTGAWDMNYGNGNHPGEQPPKGFRVPIYFELGSTPAGHVAIQLEDGRVASSTQSGTHPTAYIHPNMQDLINVFAKYNGYCRYLGWSEWIGRKQVIGGNMAKFTKQQEQTAALMATGSIPGENYNYPFTVQDITSDSLDKLLQTWQDRMNIITTDMEKAVADGISGIPNFIGKDYNSPFVGKSVVGNYPDMVSFWIGQKPTVPVAPPDQYIPYILPPLFTKKEGK